MVISIEFGALSDPIRNQLQMQNIKIVEEDAERLESLAWSLTLLHLHGIIPDSVRDNGRKKIMKQIVKTIEKQVQP